MLLLVFKNGTSITPIRQSILQLKPCRKVTQFNQTSGDAPQYIVLAYLTWKDTKGINEARDSPGTLTLREDVPKFSSVRPIVLVGDVTGTS